MKGKHIVIYAYQIGLIYHISYPPPQNHPFGPVLAYKENLHVYWKPLNVYIFKFHLLKYNSSKKVLLKTYGGLI